jgi:hypothetical protein
LTGKTVTSLCFPSPAVIDLEDGTQFYDTAFKFVSLRTQDIDAINDAIDELIKDPTGVKTLVIDPFTVYWELLQEKHLKRLRVKKGNPNYVLQPLDYKAIKNELRGFINKLMAVDLNIIVTARSKPEYANDTGDFMKVVGRKPDGPKELPFLCDVVLELIKNESNTRTAIVIKDRTNKLPQEPFEFTYQKMTEYFGLKDLEREPVILRGLQELDRLQNRNTTIVYEGKDTKTAGITAETLALITAEIADTNEHVIKEKLNDDYSVVSLLDLREDEAQLFLKDITNKL